LEILDAIRCGEQTVEIEQLPEDAKIVILILGGEESPAANRRREARCAYQISAVLKNSSDGDAEVRRRIYTRDANQWGVGFVTQEPVPVGAEAYLLLTTPDGNDVHVRCCIIRCREALPGWYEGAAVFFEQEPSLSPEAIQNNW
jgi:hypothetical protein